MPTEPKASWLVWGFLVFPILAFVLGMFLAHVWHWR